MKPKVKALPSGIWKWWGFLLALIVTLSCTEHQYTPRQTAITKSVVPTNEKSKVIDEIRGKLRNNRYLPFDSSALKVNKIEQISKGEWQGMGEVLLLDGKNANIIIRIKKGGQITALQISPNDKSAYSHYLEPRLNEMSTLIQRNNEIALKFLQQCGIKDIKQYRLVDDPQFSEFDGPGILYHLRRQDFTNNLRYDILVFVSLSNAYNGYVINYTLNTFEVTLPEKPKITQINAVDQLKKLLLKEHLVLGGVLQSTLTVLRHPPEVPVNTPVWDIYFYFEPKNDKLRVLSNSVDGGHAYIDASSGKMLLYSTVGISKRTVNLKTGRTLLQATPDYLYPEDRWPLWSPDGKRLLFISNRLHNTAANSPSRGDALFIWEAGDIKVLFANDQVTSLSTPVWSPDGKNIAFTNNNQVYDLNMENGLINQITTKERPGSSPSWSPDGKSIAVMADRGDGDTDIFNIIVHRSPEIKIDQWRVAPQKGNDKFPVFSADGKSIYYIHSDQVSNRMDDSLWGVESKKSIGGHNLPRKVIDHLGVVFSMQTNFDRTRLILWGSNGVSLIDTTTNTKRSLPLKNMKVSDCQDCTPLLPSYPSFSNDARITLGGLLWNHNPTDEASQYIYTVDADGRNLKRVTPVVPPTDETLVAPYKFGNK